jgi:hypothetical protein
MCQKGLLTFKTRSSRVVPLKLCYVVFNRTKKVTIQALGSDHFYVDLFAFL